MADIYIIAGPPGIGKSTSGYKFLPKDVPVIDPDHIAQRYKVKGFADYKDSPTIRIWGISGSEERLGTNWFRKGLRY